ncbi:tautomerase family protein [Aquabacterium sp. OR-4]|uniref:tautomerase family protein n=1 Tax=Aquabacterium sp. OR-4 TaxID=2978127 RepID=UPI0021B470C5|nr:tautomerase family protein [Aquabacterium sp. OR-4]MDT7837031.1 tautomerase family protein [Aquabacterium sp. OR-4]
MPVANIHVLAGHPRPVLKQLLREASMAFAQAIDAPPERLQVWITEVDPGLYALAGEPADEVLARGVPRAEAEIPLIRMALMEGRPVATLHRVMADLSAAVARVLGGDPQRVRVQIDHVHPERWAIGGVPASQARAAELARRAPAASGS